VYMMCVCVHEMVTFSDNLSGCHFHDIVCVCVT